MASRSATAGISSCAGSRRWTCVQRADSIAKAYKRSSGQLPHELLGAFWGKRREQCLKRPETARRIQRIARSWGIYNEGGDKDSSGRPLQN